MGNEPGRALAAHLTMLGKVGAFLIVAAPILVWAGFRILRNGDPSQVGDMPFLFAGVSLAVGLILLILGREYRVVPMKN